MTAVFVNSTVTGRSRRRWYQFSLRTLLAFTTLLSIPCAYVGWQASIVRCRRAILQGLSGKSANYTSSEDCRSLFGPSLEVPEVSWIRRTLGDEAIWFVDVPEGMSVSEIDEIKRAFPEAKVAHVIPPTDPD